MSHPHVDDGRSSVGFRVQRWIGLVPLSLFAVFHLWLNWSALEGRDAWLARVRSHAFGMWLGAGVLALFAAHALLGFVRVLRAQRLPRDGRSSFQALTGGALLFFLIYHLTHVWPPSQGAQAALSDSYERLWELLGRPIPLIVYVLGSAGLAFHLAHGWSRSFESHLPSLLRSMLQYSAGIAGLALFVLYLQLVGWFALGEAVIPLAAPGHAPEAQEQLPSGPSHTRR